METEPTSMGLPISEAPCTCLDQAPLWWCPTHEAVTTYGGACDRPLCYGVTRERLQPIEIPDVAPVQGCPHHGWREDKLEDYA